ncbi:transcriptional regulator [Pseudomonas hunanensis]|uniref:Transcriptional regulator n=2 Tax=Pseudomonas hunanensis TaxID=1247546 RepID=A0ABD6MWA6_9PSED|nr:transcriptional regulator [Pseudomonas hunanensis]
MPNAAILLYDGCYASSAGGVADILQVANAHLAQNVAAHLRYSWDFISMDGGAVAASNGLAFSTRKPLADEQFDFVYIPASHYRGYKHFVDLLASLGATYDWLTKQWSNGAQLAATCTGTFLLAKTGLLDGRTATTTWWLEEQFRSWFPNVDLQMKSILTEVDGLFCAGALSSYHLQSIKLIERYSGASLASLCAKSMLIDVSQTLQTPYLPLLANRAHTDTVVLRAQAFMQENLAGRIRLADLADRLAVSERTLIRRFNNVLGQSPVSYLQNLRIEAARSLLETGEMQIESVAEAVGYQDNSSFVRLFRERLGLTPGAYRKKFRLAMSS